MTEDLIRALAVTLDLLEDKAPPIPGEYWQTRESWILGNMIYAVIMTAKHGPGASPRELPTDEAGHD